jgi:3-(3-hydroxy-phenyl)propionate hydroxylase
MTTRLEDVDVLVVGYGPVGGAIAGLLGRYGVRTLVVDKSPGIFMAPRAIALDNEALRILQMVGIPPDAFAQVSIPYVRLHSPRLGQFAQVNTAGSIDGYPKLVTFYQPELEQRLRANAQRHPCVSVRTGVEMARFTEESEGVTAVLRAADGAEERVRAKYLVGADGANSKIRAAIGEDFDGMTYGEDWLVVDGLGVRGDFDHVEFLCNPARPAVHMVAPGDRHRWEFMLRPGETREQMEKDSTVEELLRPWGKPGEIRVERKAVYRFQARVCARFSKGRVFLAGDAAHLTPPFVGQGLVAGLRDAVNLSWKLAWVVHGRAAPSVLDTYDQERRPHAARMIALARWMGRLVMPQTRAHALALHGGMHLLRGLPQFRSLIDELGIKPVNSFREGLFAGGRGAVRRGSWFPQGLIRDVAGGLALSDDLLGPGFSVVGMGANPAQKLPQSTARAWSDAGGTFVEVRPRGCAPNREASEDLDNALVPGAAPFGWCVVLRPDRTVLHDGPLADAATVVHESLALLR